MADLFRSKKFQAAIIGLIVAVAGHYGLNLSDEALWAILSPILVYIGAQGLADALPGKERAMVESALEALRVAHNASSDINEGELVVEEKQWP